MANDALTNKLVEVIGQLQSTMPKATSVAMDAVRADALANIIQGGLSLALLLIAIWFWLFRFIPWARQTLEDDDLALAPLFGGIGLGILTLISVIGVLTTIADPWTYIALAHPELWIAHQIIAK